MAAYGSSAPRPILFDLHSIFLNGKCHHKKKSRFPDCIDYQGNVVTRGPVFTWQQQAGDSRSFLRSGPAFFHLPHFAHLPTSPQCPVTHYLFGPAGILSLCHLI